MSTPSGTDRSLLIVVVLYGTAPADSLTLKTLLVASASDHGFVGEIVVWDNSPKSFGENSLEGMKFSGFKVSYIESPDNPSLAWVYNEVSEGIEAGSYIILDQDSELPADYFLELQNHLEANSSVDLFLPLVYSGDRCVSPGKLFYFKGRHVSSPELGVRASRNVLAITSGMVIRARYLRSRRFDERLSLYGIDTKFMLDYAESGKLLVVMPIKLEHNTALWSDISADQMLRRVQALVGSWPVVFEKRSLARLLARCYGRLMLLRLAIRYRDSRFLFA
ncbi:hypothetical protein FJU31_08660 [Stenotrophomonas cyclobalanopsidis]|uniref:Glycosyltransferase n=1 Tax=Stenotrophomonas cyclobalanopsidis TaxID=2771362 RepID=A0ABQ6T1L7_9GAMM|nr:hypothetical protein [Stenotrophomonas cyclobalanopsidis]KAA8999577.1 hypothetical protein FJU31_08660 [Stenotrophomonas cyclobalanopsidis]